MAEKLPPDHPDIVAIRELANAARRAAEALGRLLRLEERPDR